MVVAVTNSDISGLNKMLAANLTLAQGYNTLYQGQSATGPSPGVDPADVTGIYNGNLATVEGAGQQPGSPTATTAFLPPGAGPKFPSPHQGLVQGNLNTLPRPGHRRGGLPLPGPRRRPPPRAEQLDPRPIMGQPITIGSIGQTGIGVTINSPGGGQLTIGQNLVVGNNATILGDATTKTVIGDNVTIGNGAVVEGTSLGSGSTVGDRAYLLNSTFPAGTQIPAGAIYDQQRARRIRGVVSSPVEARCNRRASTRLASVDLAAFIEHGPCRCTKTRFPSTIVSRAGSLRRWCLTGPRPALCSTSIVCSRRAIGPGHGIPAV